MGKHTDSHHRHHNHAGENSELKAEMTETTTTTTLSLAPSHTASTTCSAHDDTNIDQITTSVSNENKSTSASKECSCNSSRVNEEDKSLQHENDSDHHDHHRHRHNHQTTARTALSTISDDENKERGKDEDLEEEKKENRDEEGEGKEETEETKGEDSSNASQHSGVPVDRGWAWVVMIAQFVMTMLVVGYGRSLGIFFLEFIVMFHVPQASATIVFGVMTAAFGVGNLLVSHVLLSRFSTRKLQLTGGVINGMFLALTAVAPNIIFVGFTHCIIGFSHSLLFVPGVTLVGHYFDKRRSLALAVTNTGLSVSALVFPPLTEFLINHYGTRGALLLLAGVELQCVVASCLMRPVSFYTSKTPRLKTEGESPNHAQGTQETKLSKNEEKEGLEWTSTEGTTTRLLDDFDHVEIIMDDLLHQTKFLSPNLSASLPEKSALSGSVELCHPVSEEMPKLHQHRRRPQASALPHYSRQQSCPAERLHPTPRQELRAVDSLSKRSVLTASVADICGSSVSMSPVDPSRRALSTLGGAKAQTGTEEDSSSRGCCGRCVRFVMTQIIDVSLFKNWLFLLILTYIPLGFSAAFLMFYFPSLAVEMGLSRDQAAMLLSVMGVVDLVSRLSVGYLADLQLVKRTHLVAACVALMGLASQFCRFYTGLGLLAMFVVVYGLVGGVCNNLFAVVVIDLVGLPLLGKVMGLVMLFNAAFASFNHVLVGTLADSTGSFVIPFHYIGASLFLSSIILLLEPVARRLETKRMQKLDSNATEPELEGPATA